MKASVPSPKSLGYPAEPSWAMARRDDDDVSRRYFEEEQRRQGPRGPARLARDFGDGTLDQPFGLLKTRANAAGRIPGKAPGVRTPEAEPRWGRPAGP